MARVSGRIAVAFNGEGAGDGELSWGQRDVWASMSRYKMSMPVGGVKPLPEGTTVAQIAEELAYLMGRYQVMRTRLKFAGAAPPRQVVFAHGEIDLEIVDSEGDSGAAAAETCVRYQETPYDYENEWPVRMAVVQDSGKLTHMVVIMHHLAMDGVSGEIMMREVADRNPLPVTGLQPLEQARWQQSAAGQRQNEAALKHWRSVLERMPEPWPQGPHVPRQPRNWEGYFDSPAMLLAAQVVSHRTGADLAPVLLTAFGVAIGRIGKLNPVPVKIIVSNRFRPGLSDVVCPVSQAAICLLDVIGTDFETALDRTRKASMVAYKFAYYDTVAKDQLVEAIRVKRGQAYAADCHFNDRRMATRGQITTPPTLDSVVQALPRKTFRWVASKDTPSSRVFVQFEDVADTALLNIFVDTQYVSLDEAQALLAEMETVIVDAALSHDGSDRLAHLGSPPQLADHPL